jgi:hypothetical protein
LGLCESVAQCCRFLCHLFHNIKISFKTSFKRTFLLTLFASSVVNGMKGTFTHNYQAKESKNAIKFVESCWCETTGWKIKCLGDLRGSWNFNGDGGRGTTTMRMSYKEVVMRGGAQVLIMSYHSSILFSILKRAKDFHSQRCDNETKFFCFYDYPLELL